MARKTTGRAAAYLNQKRTERSPQTGNIDARNNNENNASPTAVAPNVETASDDSVGDSGLNDQKLSNFTQNHSMDA